MSHESDVLTAALGLRALGCPVIPVHRIMPDGICSCRRGACKSPGKHPVGAWKSAQSTVPSEDELRALFGPGALYEGYNLGLVTGAVSGVFAVDIDVAKDGDASLHDLEQLYGPLPHTVEARTGSGGSHLLFALPHGITIRNGVNVLGRGIDVRGEGGMIVVEPSMHVSGGAYRWVRSPFDHQPAIAPGWLVEAITGLHSGRGPTTSGFQGSGIIRDEDGKVIDGRDTYMLSMVSASILSRTRQLSRTPTVDEVFADAWPTYSENVAVRGASLEADGRGQGAMRQKIANQLAAGVTGRWKEFGQTHEMMINAPVVQQLLPLARPPIPLLWAGDIQPRRDEHDFVQGLLGTAQMSVLYGPSNVGKSFFALDLGLRVALGWNWRDRKVERGGVIYCALEGERGISNRVAAAKQHHGLHDRPIDLAVVGTAVDLRDPNADVQRLIDAIQNAAETIRQPVKLLILDTLSRAMAGGDENSSVDMSHLVRNVQRIQEATGAHVMLIHHTGKDESRGARGHSSLRAAADTEIQVGREGLDIVAVVQKQRDMECSGSFVYQLEQVALGFGEKWGQPIVSCVVQHITDRVALPKGQKDAARENVRAPGPKQVVGLVVLEALQRERGYTPAGEQWIGRTTIARQLFEDTFLASLSASGFKVHSKTQEIDRGPTVMIENGLVSEFDDRVWIAPKGEKAIAKIHRDDREKVVIVMPKTEEEMAAEEAERAATASCIPDSEIEVASETEAATDADIPPEEPDPAPSCDPDLLANDDAETAPLRKEDAEMDAPTIHLPSLSAELQHQAAGP